MQIEIYTDVEVTIGETLPADAKWGWRYGDEDTGTVFVSRDDAFDDALANHPEAPIG